jgi:hypothetical protein
LKEITESQRALEQLAKQTSNLVAAIQNQNEISDQEIDKQLQLLDQRLQDQIVSNENSDQEIKTLDQRIQDQMVGLTKRIDKQIKTFDDLGLWRFLWDKKKELELEAKAAISKRYDPELAWRAHVNEVRKVDGASTDVPVSNSGRQSDQGPDRDFPKQVAHNEPNVEQVERVGLASEIADPKRQFKLVEYAKSTPHYLV